MNIYLVKTKKGKLLEEAKNKSDLIHILNKKGVKAYDVKRVKPIYLKKGDYIPLYKVNEHVNNINI